MNISSNKFEPLSESSLRQEQSQDKGCDLAPCCLDCSFPACIKEEVGGGMRWLKARRDASISELQRTTDISIGELGKRFNVSKRTVYRALERDNEKSKVKSQKVKIN